ncbi:pirin family protein [Psychrobacter ciconiae]|uniref:pirin family protein n=1 Tax=Psychrobacter ciconiae TaxID=1553449 RepID=UPI001918D35F|nr:pirin family protein [Psychrobacter ciconiae]
MRPIKKIHSDRPQHWVGDGFLVQTVINHLQEDPEFNYQHTDPFLLLDFGTPTEFAPNPNFDSAPHGIGKHPHKGFETVTVAYHGAVSHKDSSGGAGTIYAGDVQWMTAGRGIVHEEFHAPEFGKTGGIFSMAQLWVNLPNAHKGAAPNYQAIKRAEIPALPILDLGSGRQIGQLGLIAGQVDEQLGAAKTFTPINVWDIELTDKGTAQLSVANQHTLLLLIQEGQVMINDEVASAGQLIEFEAATPMSSKDRETFGRLCIQAPKSGARILLLSGKPIGEPIAAHGPFVMTTADELKQAFSDYRRGHFG